MSSQAMHTYRVALKPLGSWHFSNPRSSGLGNQNDYFHETRLFPTQTALFGTLRRAIGIAAGLLSPVQTTLVQDDKLEALIGPIEWQTHTGSFGQIEGISPVFISKADTDYIYRPHEGILKQTDEGVTYWEFPGEVKNDLGTVSFPLRRPQTPQEILVLDKVNAKTYYDSSLVPVSQQGNLDVSAALKVDDCIKTFSKEHVNTIGKREDDLEGFYVMQRSRFTESSFQFVTYLQTNQPLSPETLEALNKLVAPLHGGDNQFALHIKSATFPTWITDAPGIADAGSRLIALSPVKVFKSYTQSVQRAHTHRYAHRVLERKAADALYAKPTLSGIDFWADKGSVFWPKATNESSFWPPTPNPLARQGFGFFYHLSTPAQS